MIWSGQRSRYSAEMTPRITAKNTAMISPMNVSCSVMGKASATRWATDMSRSAVGAEVAFDELCHEAPVLHDERIVQTVLFRGMPGLALLLRFRPEPSNRLVDGGKAT